MKFARTTILLMLMSVILLTGLLLFIDLHKVFDIIQKTDFKYIFFAFTVMVAADLVSALKMNFILDLQMSFKFIIKMFVVNQRTIFLRQFLPSDLSGISFRSDLIAEYTSDESAFFSIIYDKYSQVIATIILGFLSTIILLILWGHRLVFLGSLLFLIIISLIIILLNLKYFQVITKKILPKMFAEKIIDRSVKIKNLLFIQKQIISAIFISCIVQLVYVFSIKLICRGIDINIDYLALVIAISMVSIIIMLPISFSGFGLREVSLVVILSLIMIPPDQGFAISIFILLLSFLKLFISAVLNTTIVLRRKLMIKQLKKYNRTV